MQVGEAAGGRQRQLDHPLGGDRVAVQVVEEGPVLVVVGHQPQLRPGAVVWGGREETNGSRRLRPAGGGGA